MRCSASVSCFRWSKRWRWPSVTPRFAPDWLRASRYASAVRFAHKKGSATPRHHHTPATTTCIESVSSQHRATGPAVPMWAFLTRLIASQEAGVSPARVRSDIRLRSNSASDAKMPTWSCQSQRPTTAPPGFGDAAESQGGLALVPLSCFICSGLRPSTSSLVSESTPSRFAFASAYLNLASIFSLEVVMTPVFAVVERDATGRCASAVTCGGVFEGGYGRLPYPLGVRGGGP